MIFFNKYIVVTTTFKLIERIKLQIPILKNEKITKPNVLHITPIIDPNNTCLLLLVASKQIFNGDWIYWSKHITSKNLIKERPS